MIHEISIVVSRKCNLLCPHCYSESGNINEEETTTEELINFMEQFPRLEELKLTGGEPMMPGVYEKTNALCKYAASRNLKLKINTNGTFSVPKDFSAIPSNTTFQVSLDGMKEVHDMIRGEVVFDKACEFIRDVKQKGFNVFTMTVMSELNNDNLEELIKFIKTELQVPSYIQVLSDMGRGRNVNPDYNPIEAYERAIALGGICRKPVNHCTKLLSSPLGDLIAIDNKGFIIPCPYLRDDKFGTIREPFNEYMLRLKMTDIHYDKTCSFPNGCNTWINKSRKDNEALKQ
jgi:MoaA/NifB/PqqE/SkfB family radical SAM enzyme